MFQAPQNQMGLLHHRETSTKTIVTNNKNNDNENNDNNNDDGDTELQLPQEWIYWSHPFKQSRGRKEVKTFVEE